MGLDKVAWKRRTHWEGDKRIKGRQRSDLFSLSASAISKMGIAWYRDQGCCEE